MKATDPRLQIIAQMAKVRPPHVFHVIHALGEQGFDVEAFANFAMLEARHVEAILAALSEKKWMPSKLKRSETKERATALPRSIEMTDTWKQYAIDKHAWSDEDIAAEFVEFTEYFWQHGKLMVDWTMTWQRWVRNSRRLPNSRPERAAKNPAGMAVWHDKQAAFYDRIGNEVEADSHRAKAAAIRENNVVAFKLVG